MDLCHLQKPVFIIDRYKALQNLERMAQKAKASGVNLRPHVKTHQSAAIAGWLRDFGIRSLTASSVDMASYFVCAGWKDITVAIPVNVHQIPTINALAESNSIHVIVDSEFASEKLVAGIKHPLHVWIETDTGDHRTGVPIEDTTSIIRIANILRQSPCLHLMGFLAHDGHTYSAIGHEGVRAIFNNSFRSLTASLKTLESQGFSGLQLSIGDTPTCSIVDSFPTPINEIRPGNFIFYDLTQAAVGACRYDQIAAAVACPVISSHPERGEIVIYGGGVHISKELIRNEDGSACYGRICRLNEDKMGWTEPLTEVSLVSLSQEQGIIRGPKHFIQSVDIGDTVVVLPVHVCLTANLHNELYVLGGDKVPKFHI